INREASRFSRPFSRPADTSIAEAAEKERSMISRRHFLRAGAAVLALPRLESLAMADGKATPNRMVLICAGFGFYGPAFFPEKGGRDYEPSDYMKVLGDLRD